IFDDAHKLAGCRFLGLRLGDAAGLAAFGACQEHDGAESGDGEEQIAARHGFPRKWVMSRFAASSPFAPRQGRPCRGAKGDKLKTGAKIVSPFIRSVKGRI